MSDIKKLTLVQKLSKISDEIGKLEKDGVNTYQKYKYLSIEGVYEAVGPLLAKYEVFVSSKIIECNTEHVPKQDGKIQFYATVWIEYTFHSGSETLTTQNYGSAMDSSDKASTQAMRACHKYAYIQAFNISSGDKDPDSKNPEATKTEAPKKPKKEFSKISKARWSIDNMIKANWDKEINDNSIMIKDNKGKSIYITLEEYQKKEVDEYLQTLEAKENELKESSLNDLPS